MQLRVPCGTDSTTIQIKTNFVEVEKIINLKRKIIKLLVLAIIAPLGIALAIYSIYIDGKEEISFASALIQNIQHKQSDIFVRDIVSLDWDTVCYVPPYPPMRSGARPLEKFIPSEEYEKLPNLTLGIYYKAFAFLKERKIVKILAFKRPFVKYRGQKFHIDYTGTEKEGCISREEAIFSADNSNPKYKIIYFKRKGEVNVID